MLKLKMVGESGVVVRFSKWASNNGLMPLQAQKGVKFEIKVDKKTREVWGNTSKSGVQYYYTNVDNEWCWTRDDASAHSEWKTFVKEAKKSEAPTEAPKVEEKPKRQVKVIKKK